MAFSPEELAKRERFAQTYARSQCSAILAVERHACGCDYGGNSLTTRDEALRMATILDLGPGVRLLDVGAGTGWPGLYMAKETGCDATMVDLPLNGLQIATERAAKDDMSDRCRVAVADGSGYKTRSSGYAMSGRLMVNIPSTAIPRTISIVAMRGTCLGEGVGIVADFFTRFVDGDARRVQRKHRFHRDGRG